jgi:hypothetical protein
MPTHFWKRSLGTPSVLGSSACSRTWSARNGFVSEKKALRISKRFRSSSLEYASYNSPFQIMPSILKRSGRGLMVVMVKGLLLDGVLIPLDAVMSDFRDECQKKIVCSFKKRMKIFIFPRTQRSCTVLVPCSSSAGWRVKSREAGCVEKPTGRSYW